MGTKDGVSTRVQRMMTMMTIMMMMITMMMMKDLEGNMGSWTTARSTQQGRRVRLVQSLWW